MPARTRPGDRHHLRGRVLDQRAAGVAVAADDVEDARRQELGAMISAISTVVTGVVSDGLSTTRVAGRDRRGELPDRHHHRVVPRRDLRADADRLAADERRVPGHVLAGRAALEHPRRAGEEADLVDHRRDLLRRASAPSGLPVFSRLGATSSSARSSKRVGDARAAPSAARPGVVSRQPSNAAAAAVHGGVDVRAGRRPARVREHLAGGRVDEVARPAVGGVDGARRR